MNEPILTVRVETGEGVRVRVLAPRVGLWSSHPLPGALLGAGARAGTLEHLTRRYAMVLPEGVRGRISGSLPGDRVVPVEYGEVLFELVPLGSEEAEVAGLEEMRRAGAGGDLPEGTHGIVAPTDGVFYRSPSPGAPPFVAVGGRLSVGQPLGLVEVMKTFNQICYGGPGLPEDAEVVEIRCADGEEVRAGQILVVVR